MCLFDSVEKLKSRFTSETGTEPNEIHFYESDRQLIYDELFTMLKYPVGNHQSLSSVLGMDVVMHPGYGEMFVKRK